MMMRRRRRRFNVGRALVLNTPPALRITFAKVFKKNSPAGDWPVIARVLRTSLGVVHNAANAPDMPPKPMHSHALRSLRFIPAAPIFNFSYTIRPMT